VKFWTRRGAIAWLLWPASLVFRVLVLGRRVLYGMRWLKSAHPGIPVIVVGNLTVGGSGKTPLVIWIAEFLKTRGVNNMPDMSIGGPGFCFLVVRWNGKAYVKNRFEYEGKRCSLPR